MGNGRNVTGRQSILTYLQGGLLEQVSILLVKSLRTQRQNLIQIMIINCAQLRTKIKNLYPVGISSGHTCILGINYWVKC